MCPDSYSENSINKGTEGPGGTPRMKGVGMLVVSLRGVNFGFWPHLGCSEQNATILSVKVSFRVAREKNIKIYILSEFKHGLF